MTDFAQLRKSMIQTLFSMRTRLLVAMSGLQKSFPVVAYAVCNLPVKG
jgi:hypothetical protein